MDWTIQGVTDWATLNQPTPNLHPPASATATALGSCCSKRPTLASAEPFASNTASTSAFTLDLPTHTHTQYQPIRPKPPGGCCKSRNKSTPVPSPAGPDGATPQGSDFPGPIRSASVLPSHHNSPYASPNMDLAAAMDSPSAIYMPSFFPTTPGGSVPAAHTPLFVPSTHGTAACFCGELCACPGCPQHDPFKKKLRGGGSGGGQNSCHCGPTSEALTRTGTAGVLKPCCGGDLVLPNGVSSLEDILKDVVNTEGESLAGMWSPTEASLEGLIRPPLPPLKEIWPDSLDLTDQAMHTLQSMASPGGFDELTTSLLIAAGGGRAEQVNLAYSAFADSRTGTGGGTPPALTPFEPHPQVMMESFGCAGMYASEAFDGGCGVVCECTTECSCPVGARIGSPFQTGLVA